VSSTILIVLAGLMGAGGVMLAAAGAHVAPGAKLDSAAYMLLFHAAAVLGGAALLQQGQLWRPLGLIGLALGGFLFSGDIALRTFTGHLPIDLSSKTPAEGLFQSNAAILEFQRVENQLARLAPPSWPEDVFGRIDRDKAKAGKALFVAWPYRWTEPNKYGKRFISVGLIPQTYVGTDKAQFDALRPLAITGELSKFMPGEFQGARRCCPSLCSIS
jgi:uncharacterized membrane protein YgdD (TMEM256/DUF423 family)